MANPLSVPNAKLAVKVPRFVYGTAWKKDQTAALVSQAIRSGFRGIDTAAQPKHYEEDLVGDGIREALRAGVCRREDLHIQTKFTPPSGQDPSNLPYALSADLETQITSSINSSLRHLETEPSTYIDMLILHSPLDTIATTLAAWKHFESWVPHQIRSLGISNTNLSTLSAIFEHSTVKPALVQNRFYSATGYDGPVRAFCEENGIVYQSFWTLTGNPGLLKSGAVKDAAKEIGVSREVALYLCVMGLGNVSVLNGTTNAQRMREDLDGLETWQAWVEADANRERWEAIMASFRRAVTR
ncbi:MAG: hypothetical protein LQ342_007339 [Letrouitia transgressa]|nr:MAG: hypothetical protein LQ342_007339 [Letrouitia transgressa]